MTFISIEFLLFFAIIVFTYYLIQHRLRWILLLVASYVFYAILSIQFIPLLLASTAFTYFTGIIIEKQETKKQKKKVMLVGISVLLFFLGWFKYFNFVNDSLRAIAKYMDWNYTVPYQEIVLPLAISFYTFQAVSYLVDIYYGKQRAERHYGYFSIFFAFFPQLVAGPIERAKKLLSQFKVEHSFNYENINYGMKRIAWGFFKKTLIADRLAPIVSSVFDSPNPTGSQIVLATILFSIQLFADFSACSDIAIGCARMLGINLTENFKQPHFAVSISDFWNRWHITLSTWLRDYVFIPLCKGKKKRSEIYLAILITFLVSGIWHGAAWNFVLWGLIHGIYRVFGDYTKHFRGKIASFIRLDRSPVLHKWVKISITFLLVCFSRVFFRSDSVTHAFENAQLFLTLSSWRPSGMIKALEIYSLLDLVIFMFFFIIVQIFQYIERRNTSTWKSLSQRLIFTRFAFYIFIILSVLIFGVSGKGFVYGGF
ncbi:D-alanyl-lipoteichoic acid acyltransferase DltB (MBOAT superfamily) [Neobacillus niacini]|uniref:MBOAT family O-acyltransferase n=1 Tax=Neobacillus niacini TaxID=86668 RepID=UPI0028603FE5|nr:MBOAT family O-acyltransferase [Neobacillus niacini]MDR7079698.1 D-alanyl-lipoteichoic acid acyltransferase DltB (MBOAT superfamily) [Neobacillus niacini]